MKKLLTLIVVSFFGVCLVACGQSSTSSDLSGKYYFSSSSGLSDEPWVIIEEETLTYYSGGTEDPSGTLIFSIDEKNKTLVGENKTVAYSYKEGVLKANFIDGTSEYVKEGTAEYKRLKEKE